MEEKNFSINDEALEAISAGDFRTFDDFLLLYGIKDKKSLSAGDRDYYTDRYGEANFNIGVKKGTFDAQHAAARPKR